MNHESVRKNIPLRELRLWNISYHRKCAQILCLSIRKRKYRGKLCTRLQDGAALTRSDLKFAVEIAARLRSSRSSYLGDDS